MLTLSDVLGMVLGREEAVDRVEVHVNPSWLLGEVVGVGRSGRGLSVIYCAWGNQLSVQLGATKQVSGTLRRGQGENGT